MSTDTQLVTDDQAAYLETITSDVMVKALLADRSARIAREGELQAKIDAATKAAMDGRKRIENWLVGIKSVKGPPSILGGFITASDNDFIEVLAALAASTSLAAMPDFNERCEAVIAEMKRNLTPDVLHNAKGALEELVAIQDWKDAGGAESECAVREPLAWAAARAALAASPAGNSKENAKDVDKLHDAIMNIPATHDKRRHACEHATCEENLYDLGHRDARHAAAELVVKGKIK